MRCDLWREVLLRFVQTHHAVQGWISKQGLQVRHPSCYVTRVGVHSLCSAVDVQDTTSLMLELGDSSKDPVVSHVPRGTQRKYARIWSIDAGIRNFKTSTLIPLLPTAEIEWELTLNGSNVY